MLDVTAGYGRLSDLNAFVWEFSNTTTCLKRYRSKRKRKGRSKEIKSKPL